MSQTQTLSYQCSESEVSTPVDSDLGNSNADTSLQERAITKNHKVGGAAVAGGIAGLLLIGPVVGVLAAGGAALAASKSKGGPGQVARATGEVTVQTGRSLKKFDEKHRITEKTSKGVVKGCNWISNRLQQPARRREAGLQAGNRNLEAALTA